MEPLNTMRTLGVAMGQGCVVTLAYAPATDTLPETWLATAFSPGELLHASGATTDEAMDELVERVRRARRGAA